MKKLEKTEDLALEAYGVGAAISLTRTRSDWVAEAWNRSGERQLVVYAQRKPDVVNKLHEALCILLRERKRTER